VVLFKLTSLGLTAVAVALAIGLSLPDLVFMVHHIARSEGASMLDYWRPFGVLAVAVGLAALATRGLAALWVPRSIVELGAFGAIVAAAQVPLCALLFFRPQLGEGMQLLVARLGRGRPQDE
jgi:hypothetical protein